MNEMCWYATRLGQIKANMLLLEGETGSVKINEEKEGLDGSDGDGLKMYSSS